jgi:hypothetical protein
MQEKHVDDPFIHIVNVAHEKIEIEDKCCHGHSNHELKVNATNFIQMREEFETMKKQTTCLHVFPASTCFSCQCIEVFLTALDRPGIVSTADPQRILTKRLISDDRSQTPIR